MVVIAVTRNGLPPLLGFTDQSPFVFSHKDGTLHLN